MDAEYERLKAEADAAEAKTKAKLSDAQAKLLGRLRNRFIPVAFDDGQGEKFTINMRVPSQVQRRRLYEMRYEVVVALKEDTPESRQKIEALEVELNGLLAELCMDPSLDAEFWRTGEGFDVDVPARLMNVAMGIEQKELDDAQFFRSLKSGDSPSPSA